MTAIRKQFSNIISARFGFVESLSNVLRAKIIQYSNNAIVQLVFTYSTIESLKHFGLRNYGIMGCTTQFTVANEDRCQIAAPVTTPPKPCQNGRLDHFLF